jgi:hypothetical protein
MTNAIYVVPGTPITWGTNTSPANDYAFTIKSLAVNAGRIGAQGDLGSGARSMFYRWEATIKSAANVSLGKGVQVLLATAHSVAGSVDDNLGQSDAALTAITQFANAIYVGSIYAVGASTNVGPWHASGFVKLSGRYVSPIFWNTFDQALSSGDDDHIFRLIPMPLVVQ